MKLPATMAQISGRASHGDETARLSADSFGRPALAPVYEHSSLHSSGVWILFLF